ncbi:MAG: MFS transporter, partial [Pseudomonadota bacterium]
PFQGFYTVAALALLAFALAVPALRESRQGASAAPRQTRGRVELMTLLPFLVITFLGVASFAALKQVTGLTLADRFGLSPPAALAQTGAVLTASALAMVFAQIVLLRLLRLRPWMVIAGGCVVALVGLGGAVLAQTPTHFAISMGLIGLSQGLILPSNLALLTLACNPDQQGVAAGINAISQGLGLIAGPIAGASLFTAAEVAPFGVLLAAYAGLLAAAGFAATKSPQRHASPPPDQSPPPPQPSKSPFGKEAARTYDERIKRLVPGYNALHETACALLASKVRPNARLLVIGCGTGHEIARLARLLPGASILAIDPSEEMLAIAKETAAAAGIEHQVTWECVALDGLTLEAPVDAALCLLVTHFIPDDGAKDRFFAKAAQCLAPGGLLIAGDLAALGIDPERRAYLEWARSIGLDTDKRTELMKRLESNFHPLTNDRLRQLLLANGFSVEEPFFQSLDYRAYWTERDTTNGGKIKDP